MPDFCLLSHLCSSPDPQEVFPGAGAGLLPVERLDMPGRPCPRLTLLRRGAVAVTLIGLAVVPVGTPARATIAAPAALAARPAPAGHFNVAQAHSPQLLRALAARPPGARPAALPVTALLAGSLRRAESALPARVVASSVSPALAGAIAGAVQGVDVASFQEQGGTGGQSAISWPQVAAAGIQFAAIKVSEGAYYVNALASSDLPAAKAAGLAVLAYAFAIPNGGGASASPVVQADDLISRTAGQAPSYMLDVEYDPYAGSDGTNQCYGLTQTAMRNWISAFGTEMLAKTGRLPVIYTTQDWWAACTGSSTAFSQYPLWVADYTTAPSPAPLPAGWGTWNVWQYTSSGTVAGIPADRTDLDQLKPAAVTILNPGTQQDAVRTPASLQVRASATGLAYSAAGLPPGLTLNSSTAQITGEPVAAGAYQVTITATDPTSLVTASVSFTWLVHGTLTVTPPPARATVAGSPVDFPVRATDSVSGQQVAFTATRLPPGVSITAAGQVSGWPDVAGSYQVTVTGQDGLKATGTASLRWTVSRAPDRGPVGAARSTLAGKCLADIGNRAARGTQAEASTCNGSSAQSWTYVQDGTVRIHGMCLTAPGAHPASGARVALAACTGATRQQWQPAYPRAISAALGAIPTTLRSPWSGMCLTDPRRAAGTRAVISTGAGSAAQSWTLPAGPLLSQVPGKCADDSGNGTASGNKIEVWRCDGGPAQRWILASDGTVRVHGKCLSVSDQGTASGSPITLQACGGTGSQLWHLTPHGVGFTLVNPRSGLCLADPGAATVNGTRLVIAACAATPGLLWRAS
jgi:GH25 family lysozyme M1 (1,4-beta-N-acetylmuramidase)